MPNRSFKPLADTLAEPELGLYKAFFYADATRSDHSAHDAVEAKNLRVALLTTCGPTVVFDCSCVFVATRPLIGTSIRVSVCTSCRQHLPIATDTTSIRRHKEAQTIYDIANHLPLGKDQLERANQSILLRLAVQYIKLRRVFRDTFKGIKHFGFVYNRFVLGGGRGAVCLITRGRMPSASHSTPLVSSK